MPLQPGLPANRFAAPAIVAGVLLAALAASPGAAQDLIFKRDGRRLSGPVRACVAERCQLGSTSIPWSEIRWIGLAVGEDAPPASPVTREDLLFLRDDRVIAGKLVGVSTGIVALVQGEFERRLVKWILLGTEGAPDDDTAGVNRGPEAPPPVDTRGGGRGGTGTGGGGGGGGGRPLVKPCPPDKPLGGHVNYGYRVKDRDYQECSGTTRMWFRLHPTLKHWPTQLSGTYHADAVDYRLKNDGCTDVPDPYRVCTAPSVPEKRGRIVFGPVGAYGVDLLHAPGGTISFEPTAPELSFLTLPEEIRSGSTTPLRCDDIGGGGWSSGAWTLPVIGDIEPETQGDCQTNENSLSGCVPPTPCTGALEHENPDCLTHPDRYALIPWEGHDSADSSIGGVDVTVDYRWEVCCGCGEPPSGPPPEFSQDPCGDLGIQRGLMQVAVDTSAALRQELRPYYEKFQTEKHQAEQWRGDFETVVMSCAGWDIAVSLTGALLGGAGAPEGLGPPEGAAAFSKLLDLINAVLDQDPTYPLNAFLGAAEELEVAGETALEVKLLGIEGFTASGVIGTVGTITDGITEFMNSSEVQQQRERFEECTDTPMVAEGTYDGAREYLDHAEAAIEALSHVLPLMTRIEQSDTDIYNKWANYHRACLQYAECKGLDPAVCNPPPP